VPVLDPSLTTRGRQLVWAIDVDGTLIGSIRSSNTRPGAVELLAGLLDRGCTIVLWSAGGAEYAARKAGEHGLVGYVAAYYAKADRDAHGRYRTDHFQPAHAPDVFVDDVPADLPLGVRVVPVSQFFGANSADRALYRVLAGIDDVMSDYAGSR
jgi:long-chain acyl-CoA synthetase